MKFLFALFVFVSVTLSSYANCYTGFACSLSEQEYSFVEEFNIHLNNYFNKDVNETLFFTQKPTQIAYNDLFIFNTIL